MSATAGTVLRGRRAESCIPSRLERFEAPLTAAEHADALERGFDEGRREGLEVARREVAVELAECRRRADAAVAVLASLTAQVELARSEATAVAGGKVVDVALELAQAVIGREIAWSANPGLDALRRALACVAPDARPASAHLAPEDLAELSAALSELDAGQGGGGFELAGIELVADPTLRRGECVVEVGANLVDARIAPAIERLRVAMEAGE